MSLCRDVACPFRSFSLLSALEVFEKFSTKIHGLVQRFMETNISFGQNILVRFLAKMGQILVRFSGKIGQIVIQILENFSQILIISTL